MAASQRLGRGFHRLALFLCAVCGASQSFAAQITDMQTKFSMLCVAEKGTGFDWKDNDWVQSNYKPYSYIVEKVEPDEFGCTRQDISPLISPGISQLAKSEGCYQLKEIGEKDSLTDPCRERWKRTESGYVLLDVICEGLSVYRAEVDGPFVLTRTYGVFATGVGRDSVVLQIGKCSLLTGTPNEK